MKVLRIALAVVLFAPVLWPTAVAAQEKRPSVSVSQSGSDTVGAQLTFAVREAIRRSAAYELTVERDALFRISLITIDPERGKSGEGNWTACAVVITMRNWIPLDEADPQTWYPIYLTSSVVTVGTKAVDDSAKTIIAQFDEAVEQFKRELKPAKQ